MVARSQIFFEIVEQNVQLMNKFTVLHFKLVFLFDLIAAMR